MPFSSFAVLKKERNSRKTFLEPVGKAKKLCTFRNSILQCSSTNPQYHCSEWERKQAGDEADATMLQAYFKLQLTPGVSKGRALAEQAVLN